MLHRRAKQFVIRVHKFVKFYFINVCCSELSKHLSFSHDDINSKRKKWKRFCLV